MNSKTALQILFAILTLAVMGATARAAEIVELPPEELARESVLPIFDHMESVKNRLVATEGKWDLGIYGGLAMTEPIFNVSKVGMQGFYHLSESHAVGLLLAKNSAGLSSNATKLSRDYSLQFGLAPQPDMQVFVDYNLKMFYGKMSVTKWVNFSMALMTTASAGIVKFTHKAYPAMALGLATKFYMTNRWATRFDLRFIANNAPTPILPQIQGNPPPTIPEFSEFKERMHYSTNLEIGLSYLF